MSAAFATMSLGVVIRFLPGGDVVWFLGEPPVPPCRLRAIQVDCLFEMARQSGRSPQEMAVLTIELGIKKFLEQLGMSIEELFARVARFPKPTNFNEPLPP